MASAPVLERVTEAAEAVEEAAGWEVLKRLGQGLARLLTSAPALTAALLLLPTNSREDDGYKSEWDLSKLTQAPTDKDRARLDYLEAEQARRSLTDDEADELASLLAVVRKVFVGGRRGLPFYYAEKAKIAAEARAIDSTRGGHSYAEHGAHITAAQHERHLRTGQKPSGIIPLKPDGTPDIPSKSANFDSDEKYLETLKLADQQLQTEKINSKKRLKKKADFDVLGTSNTGKAYELDSLGNVTVTKVHGARAAYRLDEATGKYKLITLFPK